MATYIFQQISNEGRAKGQIPGTEDARDWFRDRAMEVTSVDTNKLVKSAPKTYGKVIKTDQGRMMMFAYDPKHKGTLPYYDRFPLIFLLEGYRDGFLGINLHYLPPLYRARLMDAIYTVLIDDKIRQSKKAKLTYDILKGASKFKYFKPCVKRYLTQHIRSRFIYIPFDQWDIALMLPTEKFKKSDKRTVWKESKDMI
jgi:hypothetical protein